MANTTVYPYGTGGSLPSSIGIINDLTTGGADNALAAEQGKVLNQKIMALAGNVTLDEIIADDSTWEESTNTVLIPTSQPLTNVGAGGLFKVVNSASGTAKTTVTITKDSSVSAENHIFMIVQSGNDVSSVGYTFYNSGGTSVSTPSVISHTFTNAVSGSSIYIFHAKYTSTTQYSKVKIVFTYSASGAKFVSGVCSVSGDRVYDYANLAEQLKKRMNTGMKGEFDILRESAIVPTPDNMLTKTRWASGIDSSIMQAVNPTDIYKDSATSGAAQCKWGFTISSNYASLKISTLMVDDNSMSRRTDTNVYIKNTSSNDITYVKKGIIRQISGNLYQAVFDFGSVTSGSYFLLWATTEKLEMRRWFNMTVTDNSEIVYIDTNYLDKIRSINEALVNKEYHLDYLFRKGKKICVYGASIDAQGGYWSGVGSYLAANVVNLAIGGGICTWQSSFGDTDVEKERIKKGWSCTLAEKQAMLTSKGVDYTTVDQSEMNTAYDKSVLENLDADLYVIGVMGGNDQVYTDAYKIPGDDGYPTDNPRNSVYGAIAYVLNALYTEKPTAKVVIMGSHELYHAHRKKAERCMAQVAADFGIPYAKWSQYFNINETNHTEYCNDDIPHWNTGKSGRATKAILKILADIRPYMTNP